MSTEREFLCSVYVVLLNPEVVNTPQIKRMPFEKAVHGAEKLAEDLRAEGYTVTNAVSARKERYRAVKATLAKECRRLISPHNRSRD